MGVLRHMPKRLPSKLQLLELLELLDLIPDHVRNQRISGYFQFAARFEPEPDFGGIFA